MAGKGTPKKYQSIPGLKVISRCRLCNSVGDPEHSNNLVVGDPKHSNNLKSWLAALLDTNIQPETKHSAICLIYGIVMFLRCHEISRIQRINFTLLIQGQASVNVSQS